MLTSLSYADTSLRTRLSQCGIKVRSTPSHATTTVTLTYASTDRTVQFEHLAAPIYLHRLGAPGRQAVVYLGPVHPLDIHLPAGRRSRSHASITCLDLQGYLRPLPAGTPVHSQTLMLRNVLREADVLKVSSAEWNQLLRTLHLTPWEALLRYQLAEVVITDGPRGGALLCLATRSAVRFAAHRATRAHCPTGAGDVFFASYIAARLRQPSSVKQALRHAAFVAAKQVAGRYIIPESLQVP